MGIKDFGWAIQQLKKGEKVCRAGWNGKGMWLVLFSYSNFCFVGYSLEYPDMDKQFAVSRNREGISDYFPMLDWIGMKTAPNDFVPWLASQSDMLSEDWELVSQ